MIALLLFAAAPVSVQAKDRYLLFSYTWPVEAASVPALDHHFRTDAANQKRRYGAMARQDFAERRKSNYPRNAPYAFDRTWTTGGQTARLLSLSSQSYVFSGGAHGNSNTKALLWDRRLGREITLNALLERAGWWDGAIRQPFCTLLDRERAKRRQEPVNRSDMFGACPPLKDVSLALADTNRNGRLDHVLVTADPYVAGAYAEGSYEISLPLTAPMLARLKPEYRASFEPQPPVQ